VFYETITYNAKMNINKMCGPNGQQQIHKNVTAINNANDKITN